MSIDGVDVSLGAFAKTYAREGFQVLPLVEAGKYPDGLLVPHGFKQATTDLDQIESWWRQSPHANIGIRCGPQTGIFVLDIDPRNDGDKTLARLLRKHGGLPHTLMSKTGGGGWHYFFKYVDGLGSKLGDGIDIVKPKGGYVVAAPSIHPDGGIYWLSSLETPIANAPGWIVEESQRYKERKRKPTRKPEMETEPDDDGVIREGNRNNTLTSEAGRMRRIGMSESQIVAALLLRNRELEPPLDEDEVRTIARSVAQYEPATDAPTTYTDYYNARRFFDANQDRLLYVEGTGWYVWDDKRWTPDKSRRHHAFAQKAALGIKDEIHAGMDADARKALLRWAAQSQDARRINGMISEARPMFAGNAERFDQKPMLFNVLNGTIDLATGEFREHRRTDYLTQLAPVTYDPKAKCPNWVEFVSQIQPDTTTRGYLKRAAGYSITGETSEQVVFVVHGSGGNGKSTFVTTLQRIIGGYYQEAPLGFVKLKKWDSHPTEYMLVKSKRLVAVIEQTGHSQINMELIKLMTGGESMTARKMHSDFEESFEQTAKLWLRYNEKPIIRETDEGTWRRVRLIPFTQTFDGKQHRRDTNLLDKLAQEHSGILNWLIEGCREWRERGLGEAPEVDKATQEYREDSDLLGQFISDCCRKRNGAFSETKRLFTAWQGWCVTSGLHPGNALSFGKMLSAAGFESDRARVNGVLSRGFRGIEVLRIPA
jgi:putative DNA primase/helicase